MLQLDHVWRTYGTGETAVVALRDATLTIADGDFIVIMGPSGSGKSTLLQILGLLDRPTSGRVSLDGRIVDDLSDVERTRLRLRSIGFVFQRFHLLPGLSALENVALPMEAAGLPPRTRYARAAELLERVGLGSRLTFALAQLSGGQRQRVAIARAVANGARLLLADEPTGALHSEDKQSVVGMLKELHAEGATVVVVTHDPDIARLVERRLEIRDGVVTEVTCPPSTVPLLAGT
jgi:ABC-type lipoprotein export system ATPase subunit